MHCGIHNYCSATWHPLQSQPPAFGRCSADQRVWRACQAWLGSRITGAGRCHRPLRLGPGDRCAGSLACREAPAGRHAGAAPKQPAAACAAAWYPSLLEPPPACLLSAAPESCRLMQYCSVPAEATVYDNPHQPAPLLRSREGTSFALRCFHISKRLAPHARFIPLVESQKSLVERSDRLAALQSHWRPRRQRPRLERRDLGAS